MRALGNSIVAGAGSGPWTVMVHALHGRTLARYDTQRLVVSGRKVGLQSPRGYMIRVRGPLRGGMKMFWSGETRMSRVQISPAPPNP